MKKNRSEEKKGKKLPLPTPTGPAILDKNR